MGNPELFLYKRKGERRQLSCPKRRLINAHRAGIYGATHPQWINERKGYRDRAWETCVGVVELRISQAVQRQLLPSLLGAASAGGEGAHCAVMQEDGSPRLSPRPNALMSFPKDHRPKIYSVNPLERLNGEIKQRTDVVGIFPNEDAAAAT